MPDNEAGCFDIYNKQGERIGAFDYSDIKVRQDSRTGKQFLISEHGTMSYDVVVLDGELKDALQNVMGVETLEAEELSGFTLKTHSGTGIQYLVREGEEGRGGKVLLQSGADRERYEALAETYFNKYPNLIHDKNAAYIWHSIRRTALSLWALTGCPTMTMRIIRTTGASYFREIPIRRFSTGCKTTGAVLKKCRNSPHGRMCLTTLAAGMTAYGLMKKKNRGI